MINLESIKIEKDDIVIDCGANVGAVTDFFYERGARIFAFEPNIHAYNILNNKYQNSPTVTCYNKAVAESALCGKMKLYLHEHASTNQIIYSTGSSLVPDKVNVNEEEYLTVEVISLCDFIKSLKEPVRVLKVDIEGAEIALLNEMIDRDMARNIPYIFVETHEKKIPSIVSATEQLRQRIIEKRLFNINLNWI